MAVVNNIDLTPPIVTVYPQNRFITARPLTAHMWNDCSKLVLLIKDPGKMFVSVLFGEGRREIFNLNCRIANFIQCLKEKCNVDPQESVDLMDKTGELVNLSEKEQSVDLASTLLKERQIYILIRVSRSNSTDGHKYYPLLSDLGRSHPELAEVLRKLSNPIKERDRKGAHLKKGGVNQNKNKCGANNKKSVVTTPRS